MVSFELRGMNVLFARLFAVIGYFKITNSKKILYLKPVYYKLFDNYV